MLRSLRIEHFKSVHEANLTFGKVNLLIGPNGSGKSNALEALGILAAAISKGLEPIGLDERGIRLSLPTLFKSAFKKTRLSPTFRLEAVFDNGRYECSIRSGTSKSSLEFHSEALYDGDKKVFGRGPNGISVHPSVMSRGSLRSHFVESTRGLWDVFSPFAEINPDFRAELDHFSNFSIYSPQTAIMRGVAVDARVKEPLGLTGAGLATAFAEVIAQRKELKPQSPARQFSDRLIQLISEPGWADQVQIGPFNPDIVPAHVKSDGALIYFRDLFMTKKRNYLSAFDASEGTLYLTFVATLLAHRDAPGAFALDNVDGTLNPKLVRKLTDAVVSVCCNSNAGIVPQRQVFVTSHHPSALDSFDLYNDDHAVFVTHRDLNDEGARGSTKFERIRPPPGLTKDEWLVRSGGRNLSGLLLDGLVPDAL